MFTFTYTYIQLHTCDCKSMLHSNFCLLLPPSPRLNLGTLPFLSLRMGLKGCHKKFAFLAETLANPYPPAFERKILKDFLHMYVHTSYTYVRPTSIPIHIDIKFVSERASNFIVLVLKYFFSAIINFAFFSGFPKRLFVNKLYCALRHPFILQGPGKTQ